MSGRRGAELLLAAAQLAVAAAVAWSLFGREDQVPVDAVAWRGIARAAGQLAETAGRVAIAAEARYYRAVRPYGP